MTRVVVTGIGLRTSLGLDAESSWNAIRAGKSAATALDLIVAGRSGHWHGFPIRDGTRSHTVPGLTESQDALVDAGLIEHGRLAIDRERIATAIGLSKGDLHRLGQAHRRFALGPSLGDDACAENWADAWPNAAARSVAELLDLRGPCLSPVAACATGVVAVLRAAELIRQGLCDVVLAGASDSSLVPLILGAFERMRALARVVGNPADAVRPWDRERSGFLVGEGGAVLVLERADHARARGRPSYAEVVGGALGSDASHETSLAADPGRLSSLIGEALRRSEVGVEEVDYVNVHGTATRINDPLECRAIRRVLGSHAEAVSCSSNKAQIGHLLGGAGAAELAISCLALRDQFVPPTLNLTDPDPACDLDGTPGVGRTRPIRVALKLSLGFGGHLAVAVLRRSDGSERSSPSSADTDETALRGSC